MTNPQFVPGALSAGECVSNAWEALKLNYGMYLGIALMTLLMTGCIPILNLFLIGPVMGGVYYVVLRDMRGEPVDFGMMFKGFEKFVPLMIIGLIQSIPGIIGQIIQIGVRIGGVFLDRPGRYGSSQYFMQNSGPDLSALSGVMVGVILVVAVASLIFLFFWWACFFFAIPLAMEYDMSPIDAIKLSARAAMSNLGGMLLLLILSILVGLLGALMLCVGMFLVSMPVMYIAHGFAYRMVFPYFESSMNLTPPPPSAYGSFGTGMN